MTCRAGLFYFDEKRVLVAVVENVLNPLDVSGGLPFLPKLLAGAAPEPSEACLDRSLEGLGIHVCYHQDLVVIPVLDHGRYQALFVVFEVVGNLHHGEAVVA